MKMIKDPSLDSEFTAESSTPDGIRRVFLADDHPLMREGLASVIANQPDLEVCGEYDRIEGMIGAVEEANPDVIVLDLGFPDGNGIDVVKSLRGRGNQVSILIISTHNEEEFAEPVIRAGANGYVMKDEATKRVIKGIRAVLNGEVFVSKTLRKLMLNRMRGGDSEKSRRDPLLELTVREREVFNLIGQGLSSKEIAEELSISTSTIDVHKANIRGKLKVKSAPELLRTAIRHQSEKAGQF